MLLAAG